MAQPLPAETVIGAEGLFVRPGEGRLAIRLPWYRSLPLSVVEIESLSVDGKAIEPGSIRFELDGKSWSLAELADATDDFWFILDSAFLVWPADGMEPGSEHEVALSIAINPPYIPGLRRSNPQTAILTAQKSA